jgi:hypothetical protein
MKRLILLTFMSLVAVVPVYAAEIYWDTPTGDAEITDQDFKYKYDGATPAKSFRESDIYFNPGDPAPDWAAPLFESDRPAGARVQSDITETPRPRVTTPTPETARTRTRTRTLAPRPAETSPGTQSIELPPPETSAPADKKKTQTRRSQRDTSTTQAVDKPESKKLRWGQTESKPAEDKGKFQWGQKQQ